MVRLLISGAYGSLIGNALAEVKVMFKPPFPLPLFYAMRHAVRISGVGCFRVDIG
jgi:hypothetical protein